MSDRNGFEGKLFFRAAGAQAEESFNPADWNEMDNVQDVTTGRDKSKNENTTRANNGFKSYKPGLVDANIEFSMIYDPADPSFAAIQTAYDNNSAIGIAAMDGALDEPGNQGLVADMGVFNFSRKEPLDGPMTVDVQLAPVRSTVAPWWHTVTT